MDLQELIVERTTKNGNSTNRRYVSYPIDSTKEEIQHFDFVRGKTDLPETFKRFVESLYSEMSE